MKRLRDLFLLPPDTPAGQRTLLGIRPWIYLTGLGCCIGLLTLLLAATAYVPLPGLHLFCSYLLHPLLTALNLLIPVGLIWLFYLITGRCWAAYLGSAVPCLAISLVNYYKIRLRGDPMLGADLLLVNEAGGIMGHYTLDITWVIVLTALCFLAGLLFSIFLMPRSTLRKMTRIFGAVACLAALWASYPTLYTNPNIYNKTANNRVINPWSDVELFLSKGVLYPFLYSTRDMFPQPPVGYEEEQAKALLESFQDSDIPVEEKVDVVGIMLEAFCDLTDFPALANEPAVQQVYAPWHTLEAQSIHGDLITNIFAGGTVNSEWSFLTGYTQYDQFRSPTDSYVWYLREQGYDTLFHHPGYNWFYNRQNVNEYLGFRESLFTDNCFGSMVDPMTAVLDSDTIVVDYLLEELAQERDEPLFSFSVTYQNHGPYSADPSENPRLTPAQSGWSEESCNILNSYLRGVENTISNMTRMIDALERREEPVVVVLFGDHKPWMGNANSVYTEIGANFDFSTLDGFRTYYTTPYLIWANPAAREVLDETFTGEGGDFSPCFLMPRLFDACGWEGPDFMQLSRQLREMSPLVHITNRFLVGDTLSNTLSPEDSQFYLNFLSAQYYREKEVDPQPEK